MRYLLILMVSFSMASFDCIHFLDQVDPVWQGDLEDNDVITVSDAVLMVHLILENKYNIYADMNEDMVIDMNDLVILLNIIVDG